MYKRKRAGNTITRKINSTKDTAAKADKNHYISNSYLEGFIPIDTEYFTASFLESKQIIIEPHTFFLVIRRFAKIHSVIVPLKQFYTFICRELIFPVIASDKMYLLCFLKG